MCKTTWDVQMFLGGQLRAAEAQTWTFANTRGGLTYCLQLGIGSHLAALASPGSDHPNSPPLKIPNRDPTQGL